MQIFSSVYLHDYLKRIEEEHKQPLTSQAGLALTIGRCYSPVGRKDSHRTPASDRVTLRA